MPIQNATVFTHTFQFGENYSKKRFKGKLHYTFTHSIYSGLAFNMYEKKLKQQHYHSPIYHYSVPKLIIRNENIMAETILQ